MTDLNPVLYPGTTPQNNEFAGFEVELANRNSGIPLEVLQHDITPVGMHYLLSHFDIPFVPDAGQWRLTIGGESESVGSVGLTELKKLPHQSRQVLLECAGNGRALVKPRWSSQPWHYGAVSNAEWSGCSLRDLLKAYPLKASAKELVFSGLDKGVDAGVVHNFERSLTIEQALDLDVMVVWGMNGQPLLPQHGFPLRLIVPGWYGMASVKWLHSITAIDHAFEGFQQVRTYRYRIDDDDPGVPITGIRVKSLLIPPGIPDWKTRKRLVVSGAHDISGRAWSGQGVAIEKVELGVDGHWTLADLEPPSGQYAWQAWRANCDIPIGQHEISCRATDANGQIQPLTPVWDRSGMGNNAVHRVEVWVVDRIE